MKKDLGLMEVRMKEEQIRELLQRIEPVIAQFARDYTIDRIRTRQDLGRLLLRTYYDQETKQWRHA